MTSRLAIVHDFLTQFGGAERVALAFGETYTDAPIYTSIHQQDLTYADFQRMDVRTTPLQRLVPKGHFRLAAPFYGEAFARVDLSDFDQVLVSSSGFAHQVHHPNTFVYCHTPPRFIYRLDTYFSNPALVAATQPFLPWLRSRDTKAAQRQHSYAANSVRTAERIRDIYGREARVIHPPLDTRHIRAEVTATPTEARALVIGRLQPYKRIDVAIEACRKSEVPLTIVGEGPEGPKLRALAEGADVTFLGRLDDGALGRALESHSVLLSPGIEDYGMTPLEANYAGRPVIARASGGALETVGDSNGRLVGTDDPGTWAVAIDEVLHQTWDAADLRRYTEPFQLPAFRTAIASWLAGD